MIDYSLSFFGKNLDDLDYQCILDYFVDEREESNNIEFKGFSLEFGDFNKSIKGITRAICALLNSDGGIVIWGAPLGAVDETTKTKKFVGPLSPIPTHKEKDWIINKISDSITPLPVGVRVSVLQRSANENLYIFEVQSSVYKPHQFENTYLVRLDGQTKPAPHYLVDALFKRVTYPNIEGYLKFDAAGITQDRRHYYLEITIGLFNFSVNQNEENVIYRLNIFPGVIYSQMGKPQPHTFSQTEPLLHFGTPMLNSQQILLTIDEINKYEHEFSIVLTVAGKKSPVKSSAYELDFSKIDLKDKGNTSALIKTRNENELLFDKQQQLGTTKENTLTTFFRRRP